ncbi:DEAD/DEAH box helicase family protein [Rhizobiales bacterium TNE-4]|nr:DEAD/DEAH box helicase family protein [Rhizobiales bacterium TNE-4]MBV1826716.1 DEAD/DEAH box helicase family protein [Rhizobiales bacterium TNE-4]
MVSNDIFLAELERLYRLRNQPLTPFTHAVAASVFETMTLALSDVEHERRLLRVLPAPTGSGKTSCAIAFASALVKAGGSVLLLANSVNNCQDIYSELKQLLGEKVAIWSRDHNSTSFEANPAYDQFHLGEVGDYPALIATQQKFGMDPEVLRCLTDGSYRQLIIVDERPEHTQVAQITLRETEEAHGLAKERLSLDEDGVKTTFTRALGELCGCLSDLMEWREGGQSFEELELPRAPLLEISRGLQIAKLRARLTRGTDEPVALMSSLEVFVQAALNHKAFISRKIGHKRDATFVGYDLKWPVISGTVILDATGDIDGVDELYRPQTLASVPSADYRDLSISFLPPPSFTTLKALKADLEKKTVRQSLTRWLQDIINEHTEVGEKVLVVSHKAFTDTSEFRSASWNDRTVEGIWFGAHIGSNRWREFTTVIMIGEFWLPRKVTVGQTNAFKETTVSGTLSDAIGGTGVRGDFSRLARGELMRQLKQLTMRGAARVLDDKGVAAPMKLFLWGHEGLLMALQPKVFPGSPRSIDLGIKTTTVTGTGRRGVVLDLMRYLKDSEAEFISSADILRDTSIVLKEHARKLKDDPVFQEFLSGHGLVYIATRGAKGRSGFERT